MSPNQGLFLFSREENKLCYGKATVSSIGRAPVAKLFVAGSSPVQKLFFLFFTIHMKGDEKDEQTIKQVTGFCKT